MQVSVETTSGLERRLIVGVPSSRVDSAVDSRLQEAAKTVKLNGFRPGKVPMRVIRQRFGQSVRMEVPQKRSNTRTAFRAARFKNSMKWCGWRDSNSHASRHQNLNLACIPISPHPHTLSR